MDERLFYSVEFWTSFGKIFPDSVVITKLDGEMVYGNQIFKKLIRSKVNNLSHFIESESLKKISEAMMFYKKGTQIVLSAVETKKFKGTTYFSCYLFALENNMFALILTSNVDLNNRLLLLSNIVNTVPDPVFVKDKEHRWIYVNQAFADNLASSQAQILGKTDHDFFPQDESDVFHKMDRKTFKYKKTTTNEEKFSCRPKGVRTVSTKKSVFKTLEGSQILVGVIRDVTEIKEARDYLEKNAKELRKRVNTSAKELEMYNNDLQDVVEKLKSLNSDLDCFAHICCHELREPLRTISSFSKLVIDEYAQGEHKNIEEFLHIIHKGASKMDDLIKSILKYSTNGLNEKSMSLFSLNDLIDEVLIMLDFHINEKKAMITFDNMPDIYADRLQIIQLFQNLINNSIKFSPALIPPLIHIHVIQKNNFVEFRIKDNGIGIPKKFHKEIFLPFKRFHSRSEGSMYGIGLSLCKKIVENHGGSIKMSSQENMGTTFKFSLPTHKGN